MVRTCWPGLAIVVVACGPKPATERIGNAATPVDAAVASAPGACEDGGVATMTLEGAEVPIALRICTEGEEHPYGEEKAADGFIIHHRKAVLVATTPQGELPIEIALWDDGWEMGETWTLVGVLSAPPKTNGAVVLRSDGSGPAPGIEARQGSLRVMTVRHGEWQEAFLRNANVIEATIAHDAVVAASCDLARTDTGTGGPGANAPVCRDREPDQDVVAAAFTLQWDGAAIHELP